MLTDQFLDYINKEKLFKPSDKLLIAISGGVDSVVLAYLLKHIEQPFALAHMNFNLRGKASNEDAEFVKTLAAQLNVPVYIKEVEIDKSVKGKSIQMQARVLRYEWFDELINQHQYKFILTAHHSNDSFETVLLNLVRGTGIKGLSGIKSKRAKLIRPLLFATKDDIISYAIANQLSWREDISNGSIDYKRNFMRHQVIPLLEQQNPSLIKHFSATSSRLRAAENAFNLINKEYEKRFFNIKNGIYYIDRNILLEQDGIVFLHEMITNFGFSFNQLNSFDFNRIGAILETSSHVLNVDRTHLLISERKINDSESEDLYFSLTEGAHQCGLLKLEVSEIEGNIINYNNNPRTVFIDKALIDNEVLIREWRMGDKFQPLGMKGQKKVSDYLIDEKVPLSLKKHQLVLVHAGEIVWLIGQQISDKYKITQQTNRQLRISYSMQNKS